MHQGHVLAEGPLAEVVENETGEGRLSRKEWATLMLTRRGNQYLLRHQPHSSRHLAGGRRRRAGAPFSVATVPARRRCCAASPASTLRPMGTIELRRRRHHPAQVAPAHASRHQLCAAGPADHSRHQCRGQHPRRAARQGPAKRPGAGYGLRLFSGAQRHSRPQGRRPFRRSAAAARDCPCAGAGAQTACSSTSRPRDFSRRSSRRSRRSSSASSLPANAPSCWSSSASISCGTSLSASQSSNRADRGAPEVSSELTDEVVRTHLQV